MDIDKLKAYVSEHVASAEEAVKAEFDKFVAFVEGKQAEEAKIAGEVDHLTGLGYTVTPPRA